MPPKYPNKIATARETYLSTRSFWTEWELQLPVGPIYAIARLLAIRIDMCKPSNAAASNGLEVRALRVQKGIVILGHGK